MRQPVLFSIAISAVSFFLSFQAQARSCADARASAVIEQLDRQIRITEVRIKDNETSLSNFQSIANELNAHTNGKVMGTLKTALKVGFIFASSETKAKVNRYFERRLLVHGNVDLRVEALRTAEVSVNASSPREGQAILSVIQSAEDARRSHLSGSARKMSKALLSELHHEIEEIVNGAAAGSSLEKFKSISEDIVEMEIRLGIGKGELAISQRKLRELTELRSQARLWCVPNPSLINLGRDGGDSRVSMSLSKPDRTPAILPESGGDEGPRFGLFQGAR